ncbi:glutathione S-transferase [Paraglaciecola sp. L3A3]|uniref:glutathione S-transferase n=1 Tax=Paraglaciecola sp. L3A3 TaxID=2686358 RepID=UPI00131C511E|nr:glutathione S-transferase [Paraglaciecola sp. L3A3]
MNVPKTYPILYSLRNCPYAMRGRIAIYKAKQPVSLRDLVLTNKPAEMLASSPKGTVPILVLPKQPGSTTEIVLEESLELMLWALSQSDPDDLLHSEQPPALPNMLGEIARFDVGFKQCLEQYKCAKRYHESTLSDCRQQCEVFIQELEQRLEQHAFLWSDKESLLDIALLPFIRQFARIERQWYLQAPYPKVRQWLNRYLQSVMFTKIMTKYPLWLDNREDLLFPE